LASWSRSRTTHAFSFAIPSRSSRRPRASIHSFATENGFTVIVAATNLVFRDLYNHAVDDEDVKKILVLDRTPAKRRATKSLNQAPPLFYPDMLTDTPEDAHIPVDLRQFLQDTTSDPLWPPATNEKQYARLIVDNLDGVLRAHTNLVTANPGRFPPAPLRSTSRKPPRQAIPRPTLHRAWLLKRSQARWPPLRPGHALAPNISVPTAQNPVPSIPSILKAGPGFCPDGTAIRVLLCVHKQWKRK
jgi:hypothetical protein